MSKKVTQKQLISILKDLNLVDNIKFFGSGINPTVYQSNKWYQNIGGKCLDDVVKRLDDDDNNIIADLELLLDHLGLEISDEARKIIKKKKGKK